MANVHANAAPAQAAPGLQTMVAKSSWISLFEYDPTNFRLTTHLKNGSIYQHAFVLPGEWTALQTSQHHSSHFSNFIKGKKAAIHIKGNRRQ